MKRPKRFRVVLGMMVVGLMMLCSFAVVSAEPVIYDEAIDGDLVNPLFNLDVGLNQWTGTISLDETGNVDIGDFDSIRFIIPPQTTLESITYDVRLISGCSDATCIVGYRLLDDMNQRIGTGEGVVVESTQSSNSFQFGGGVLPLEAGQYRLFHEELTGFPGDTQWTAAYTVTLSVVKSVPAFTCMGFEPPVADGPVTVRGNKALPHKAQLFDENSNLVTNTDIITPPVIQIFFDSGIGGEPVDVSDDALAAGQGTDGNQYEFTNDNKWQFNLKTKGYTAPGTYTVKMTSGDESEYTIDPTCSSSFMVVY